MSLNSKVVQTTLDLYTLHSYCEQYLDLIPPLAKPLQIMVENYHERPYELAPEPPPPSGETLSFSFRIPYTHWLSLKDSNPGMKISRVLRQLVAEHVTADKNITPREILNRLQLFLPEQFTAPGHSAEDRLRVLRRETMKAPREEINLDAFKLSDKKVT